MFHTSASGELLMILLFISLVLIILIGLICTTTHFVKTVLDDKSREQLILTTLLILLSLVGWIGGFFCNPFNPKEIQWLILIALSFVSLSIGLLGVVGIIKILRKATQKND